MADRPNLLDISPLSAWLRYAKITCKQTVADCLNAIEAEPSSGQIFTHIARDRAMEEAQKLDASNAIRSAVKPLAGVPFIVEEVIAVADMPDSAATNLDLGNLMPAQSPLVKRLRDMGAVPVGKTATTEFAFSLHNLNHALPANPYYKTEPYTIGGSAAAVAVAQGLCSFALAADAADTMRASAAMCGVTAFKPGTEFWSREGVFPLSRELDSIGMVTAKASDLCFMIEMLGTGAQSDLPIAKLKLGIAKHTFYENLEPVIDQAMTRALEALSKKGAVLTPIIIPNYEELKNFNCLANGTGLARYIGRDRMAAGFAQMDPVTQVGLRAGMEAGITDIQRLFEVRRSLANRVNSNLAHIDALITPTLTGLARPVSSFADANAVTDWQTLMTRNANFASLFNMAAITLPLPGPIIRESEPIGLQLIAPGGNESRLAAVARTVQQALEGLN